MGNKKSKITYIYDEVNDEKMIKAYEIVKKCDEKLKALNYKLEWECNIEQGEHYEAPFSVWSTKIPHNEWIIHSIKVIDNEKKESVPVTIIEISKPVMLSMQRYYPLHMSQSLLVRKYVAEQVLKELELKENPQ